MYVRCFKARTRSSQSRHPKKYVCIHLRMAVSASVFGWQLVATSIIFPTISSSAYAQYADGFPTVGATPLAKVYEKMRVWEPASRS